MRLVLALPPNMANERWHWRTALIYKKAYYAKAQVDLQNQRSKWWRVEVPKPARFTATLFAWNLMDPDNATARLKWTWDCLVRAGILMNDTAEYLDPTVRQGIDRKNPRVELVL